MCTVSSPAGRSRLTAIEKGNRVRREDAARCACEEEAEGPLARLKRDTLAAGNMRTTGRQKGPYMLCVQSALPNASRNVALGHSSSHIQDHDQDQDHDHDHDEHHAWRECYMGPWPLRPGQAWASLIYRR